MAFADIIYNALIKDIMKNGVWDKGEEVRTVYADGEKAYTKAVVGRQMKFSNKEVPILTSKHVGWKTAIKEGPIWIWQMKSNVVQDLRDMGVTIWDEWELPDGTIGKAYGWQLANKYRKVKATDTLLSMLNNGELRDVLLDLREPETYAHLDQVDYLLYSLKTNRASRRHLTTLWCVEDLDEMALTPCVYETQWIVQEGKLHLVVGIRSNDLALGNPFNVFQYYVLQRMIAQVTGYELGTLTFNIAIPHVYDRHIPELSRQIKQRVYEAPTLEINPNVKSFYDFTINDFKLVGYKYDEKFNYEVAI